MGNLNEPAVNAAAQVRHTEERILAIHNWSPTVLSFRTTRYASFRFSAGHYARLGLAGQGETVWRPYSLVAPTWADYLEFLAVLIPGGAFSERLAQLRVGDSLLVEKPAYGFMTVDRLAAGSDLWLIASGTGIGPFVSVLYEPEVWRQFERLFVVHSVRHAAELAYRNELLTLPRLPWLADAQARLQYLPIVTREPGVTELAQRVPQLLANGRLEQTAAPLDVAHSRLMVCGNPELTADLRQMLRERGFATNRRGVPGQMAFEQYW